MKPEKTEWSVVDSFVTKVCAVLHICDTEAEKQIQQLWSAVSRVGSHAFSFDRQVRLLFILFLSRSRLLLRDFL